MIRRWMNLRSRCQCTKMYISELLLCSEEDREPRVKNDNLYTRIFPSIPLHFVKLLHQGQVVLCKQQSRELPSKMHRQWKHRDICLLQNVPENQCTKMYGGKNKTKKCERALSASGHSGVLSQVPKYTSCLRFYGSSWKKYERYKKPNTSMQEAQKKSLKG